MCCSQDIFVADDGTAAEPRNGLLIVSVPEHYLEIIYIYWFRPLVLMYVFVHAVTNFEHRVTTLIGFIPAVSIRQI